MLGWWGGDDERVVVARLLNAEMTARFSRQSESLNRIDTKGVALLGFTLTVATFATTTRLHAGWLVAVLITLGAAAMAGVQTIRVRTYHDAPEPAKIQILAARSERAALAALTAAKKNAFDDNAGVLTLKAKWWRRSLAFLVAGVALLAIAQLLDAGVAT